MEIPRTHEVTYRVRFDEGDASGHLRLSGLLRYAQDLAWQHSEVAGFDRAWYDERGTFWIVRMVALRTYGRARYGDVLRAITEVTGWRRVWARRHTSFLAEDGQLMAEADTDWVLMTTEGRPSRIPDEISRLFAPGSRYKPDKVEVEDTPPGATRRPFVVRAADIDPLGHLNNAAYLDLVDETAAAAHADERPTATDYRAEFIRPALAGAEIDVAVWSAEEAALACRILDATGTELFRALVR